MNIKHARAAAGFSQKELSAKIGVSSPTVSEWESGKKRPSADNLLKLASALGCTTDYILGNSEDPHETKADFEQFRQICIEFCDGYCKYPDQYKAKESGENYDKMLEEVCVHCPFVRI